MFFATYADRWWISVYHAFDINQLYGILAE